MMKDMPTDRKPVNSLYLRLEDAATNSTRSETDRRYI